jgi:hypothetical protein
MKRKATFSSETSVDFQRTTRRYTPEDTTLQTTLSLGSEFRTRNCHVMECFMSRFVLSITEITGKVNFMLCYYIVAQLVKKFCHVFSEHAGSLPFYRCPTHDSYLSQINLVPLFATYFFKISLNIMFPPAPRPLRLSSG